MLHCSAPRMAPEVHSSLDANRIAAAADFYTCSLLHAQAHRALEFQSRKFRVSVPLPAAGCSYPRRVVAVPRVGLWPASATLKRASTHGRGAPVVVATPYSHRSSTTPASIIETRPRPRCRHPWHRPMLATASAEDEPPHGQLTAAARMQDCGGVDWGQWNPGRCVNFECGAGRECSCDLY